MPQVLKIGFNILFFLHSFALLGLHCQQAEVPLTTNKGPIVGLRFDPNLATGVSYDAFLGIPYGNKPVRFQLAEARSSWTQVLSTKTDGPVCPQPNKTFSEDCLYLNVYSPMNASSTPGMYPVMVYIHGAAFTKYSASSKELGPDFLVNAGVILVIMNYRLGAAGFLTLGSAVAPGNLGLHDTLLALQWVQDEISTFGGDPTQVTLFGLSSGSIMTQMHYLSSLSADLFVRVIAQSGSVLADWGHYTAVEGVRRAKVLAQAVNCDTSLNDSALLACLQAANMTDIVNSQFVDGIITMLDKLSGNSRVFLPVLDSYLTADKPFFNDTFEDLMAKALHRGKPVITGINTKDALMKMRENDLWRIAEDHLEAFIPRRVLLTLGNEERVVVAKEIRNRYFSKATDLNKGDLLVDLYTDAGYGYPSVQMTQYFSNLTYGYLFGFLGTWPRSDRNLGEYHIVGANHADEEDYLFYKNVNVKPSAKNLLNINMKDQMVAWWTTFAKTGVPDRSWKTVAEDGYLFIDSTPSTINSSEFESRYYDFWAHIENYYNIELGFLNNQCHTSSWIRSLFFI